MSKNVFANGLEVAGAATPHKCIAAMPDVCLSPPPPPTGPVPIPYPNTSSSADMKDGTKNVSIGAKPVCQENKSYYQTSPLGDEASTKNFGANVIDHGNAGKTYCQAHSPDVIVENKAVTRTADLTTSNHAGEQPGGGAMTPQIAGVSPGAPGADAEDETLCPCCRGLRHANQKDAGGAPLKKTSSANYYAGKKAVIDKKVAGFDAWAAANPDRLGGTMVLKFASDIFGPFSSVPAQVAAEEARRGKQLIDDLQKLMSENPDCPNVPKSGDGCATHFEGVPPGAATAARAEFTKGVQNAANRRAAAKGFTVPKGTKVNHITPLDAGGCPIGDKNLVSDAELSGNCAQIDKLQTALQGR